MLFEQGVQVGPIAAGNGCGTADIALGEFQEAYQISFFKGIPGLFQRR